VLLERGWVTLSANFRGRVGVVHQQILASVNYSPWAITWCCLRDPTFSRFDTIQVCVTHADRQTDRQTDRHTMMARLLPAYRYRAARVKPVIHTRLSLVDILA